MLLLLSDLGYRPVSADPVLRILLHFAGQQAVVSGVWTTTQNFAKNAGAGVQGESVQVVKCRGWFQAYKSC